MSFCRNSTEEQDKVTCTIEDEITILGRLQHPHLIKCLGATKHTGHFNIFLEWMPGKASRDNAKKIAICTNTKLIIQYCEWEKREETKERVSSPLFTRIPIVFARLPTISTPGVDYHSLISI